MNMLPATSEWKASLLDLGGKDDDGDPLVLYYHDALECVRRLISKPGFEKHLVYEPQKEFKDTTERERVYGEMWTCDWWWETQVSMTIKVNIQGNTYRCWRSWFYHQAPH